MLVFFLSFLRLLVLYQLWVTVSAITFEEVLCALSRQCHSVERFRSKNVTVMNNTPRFKQHQSDEAVVAKDATKHVPSSFLETVKRPLAEAENVVRSSRDALSGRAFTDSLLQKDKILAQKSRPTHLLQDTVELPNEEPLPLHANSLDAYPNPLKYPLAW